MSLIVETQHPDCYKDRKQYSESKCSTCPFELDCIKNKRAEL